MAAVPDITTNTVADVVVDRVILRHGCPVQLLSDRGTQFTSGLFRRMAERLGIKKIFTSAYHPQTNGQVERQNRYIAAALTTCSNEHLSDWDEYLEAIAFAYRTSVVEAIGNTPFYLVHGRDPVMPTDVLAGGRSELIVDARRYGLLLTEKINEAYRIANEHQDKADQRRKEKYDRTHYPVEFEIGSLVLLHSKVRRQHLSLKLTYHYQGPHRVLEKVSPVNYRIRRVEKNIETIVHVQRMIPFHERVEDQRASEEIAEAEPEDDEDSVQGEPEGVPEALPSSRSGRVSRRPARFHDYD